MKQEEINQDNKLIIAKFMGWKEHGTGILSNGNANPFLYYNDFATPKSYFKYSSWDELMPVVAKINKTWEYTAMDGDAFLPAERIIQVIRLSLGDVNIENTFKNIVEFIKWYNSITVEG